MNSRNNLLINASNVLQNIKCNNKNDEIIISNNVINNDSYSENLVIKKKVSYKLINKINHKYTIANILYIGNGYFITILKKEDYEYLYRVKSEYYIKYDNYQLEIRSLIPYSNIIENNYIILLIQINNIHNLIFFEFDVINPSMYLVYEQNNIELSYEVNDTIIFNNNVISISDNYLEVEEKNKLKIGSPLFYENILIGIQYRDNKNGSFFYRLSKLYIWLNSYSLFTKKEIIKKHLYVSYSKEELFNIILCLNDRINSLEKKVEELSKK